MQDGLGALSADGQPVAESERARLWLSPDLLGQVDVPQWLADGELLLSANAREAAGAGRAPARHLRLGACDGVWRQNRHGGLLGGWRGDRFASPRRLAEEVALVERLRRLEIATPPVLLALAARRGRAWRQHLVTALVPDARTVFDCREEAGAAAAARELLEELFDVGLWAPDLHPANLLWQGAARRIWLVDLAGARLRGRPLSAGERRARTSRFLRYFDKHAGAVPAAFRAWSAGQPG